MRGEAPPLLHEQQLWAQGYRFIGGIDEAGRGAWAGPVSAAVVILPVDSGIILPLACVRDSKLMTPSERESAAALIKANALAWSVGFSSAAEIDDIGILPATRQAVMRAIQSLPLMPEFLLLDFIHWKELKNPHLMFTRGESKSLSIASASVLAKTARDELLKEMGKKYPGYGFEKHKGYGTKMHREAIASLGLCEAHRRSYRITPG